MAEDLAELTHSSDSSIDDREPPLSEQTALFIQKLNSTLGTCTSASQMISFSISLETFVT